MILPALSIDDTIEVDATLQGDGQWQSPFDRA